MKELPETRAAAIQAFKELQEENLNLKLKAAEYQEQAGKVPGLETKIANLKKSNDKPTEGKRDESGWLIEG